MEFFDILGFLFGLVLIIFAVCVLRAGNAAGAILGLAFLLGGGWLVKVTYNRMQDRDDKRRR